MCASVIFIAHFSVPIHAHNIEYRDVMYGAVLMALCWMVCHPSLPCVLYLCNTEGASCLSSEGWLAGLVLACSKNFKGKLWHTLQLKM